MPQLPALQSKLPSKMPPRGEFPVRGSLPLLIVYIFLDTLDAPAHNSACFTGRILIDVLGGERASAFHRPILSVRQSDATSARFDGAMLEPGMSCTRALVPRGGRGSGVLRQLRRPASECATPARTAFPNAASAVRKSSTDRAPALALIRSSFCVFLSGTVPDGGSGLLLFEPIGFGS
jgi:hypothetical protein